MRLLVGFGYQKVLFPATVGLGEIIAALGHAQLVDETGPWDARIYTAKNQGEIEVKLIPDDDIRLPDAARPIDIEKFIALAQERDAAKAEAYKLTAELKKIRDAAAPKAEG